MNKRREKILTGKIPPLLIKLTLPSIAGMLGFIIFNLVDTYFVGRLGTVELAAISFTFPVVMVINSISLGIATAVMALFSKAAGSHNVEEERRLATSSLILGVLAALIITIAGWLTTKPLFRLLGAEEELLPFIVTYMNIWYLGSVFIVIPMIGDHVLRGLGDTNTPAFVMLTAAVVNIILDPLLIFGIGPFPALGIAGAAIATVIARAITMCVSLGVQIFREHLISFKNLTVRILFHEWKDLIFIGAPNAAVKAIVPVGSAVFTAILAGYGHEVVAGYGVAVKIEGFFLAVCNALAITAAVFVGQNLGAGKPDRVKSGIRWLYIYSLILGVVSVILFTLTGRFLGAFFNDAPVVQQTTARYLLIVPAGYGLFFISQIGMSILNVYHKPIHAAGLSLIQIAGLAVPLAFLLSRFWDQTGLFIAIGISYLAVGVLSILVVRVQSKKAFTRK